MEYGYKPTTNGRRVIVACMDTGSPFEITRVAVGKGLIDEGTDLADQHELIDYVADGTISNRQHENNQLYLTVQYSNDNKPQIPTFYLSEFIVYVKDPDTGNETDLLYATLGDYAQPVPAYQQGNPASVFNFPLILVLSDEINVTVEAPAGVITYDELETIINLAAEQEVIDLAEELMGESGGGILPETATDEDIEELIDDLDPL